MRKGKTTYLKTVNASAEGWQTTQRQVIGQKKTINVSAGGYISIHIYTYIYIYIYAHIYTQIHIRDNQINKYIHI